MADLEAGGFCRPSACTGCGSLSFSQDWYDAFGVLLCQQCSRCEKLISKANAKATYLLSDKDLAPLGCLTKENPQQKNWTAMKLYLRSQVLDVALEKYGSLEELEELRHMKVEDKLKKRSGAGAGEGGSEAALSKRRALQEKMRQKLLKEYQSDADKAQELPDDVEVETI